MADPEKPHPMRDQIAQAIYGAGVKQAQQKVISKDLQLSRLNRVFEAADAETDRSAAILIFALAEDLMLDGLKANLNSRAWGNGKDVSGPNGPLGTAANRLTLLHLLNWVREKIVEDLRCLKAIRNHFAHHPDVADFNDQKISALVGQLQPWEKPLFDAGMYTTNDGESLTVRDKYLIRATCTVAQLSADLVVGPAARYHNVNPEDVEGTGYEKLPDNLREVRLVMADAMRRVLMRRGKLSLP